MTRLVYGGLLLDYTPTTTTFPSIAQLSDLILDLYKQAADIQHVVYSETVPDSALLYSMIKGKVSAYCLNIRRSRSVQANFTKDIKYLIWDEDEKKELSNIVDRTITIGSVSRSDRLS